MKIEYEKRLNPLSFFTSNGHLHPVPHFHKELEILYVKKGRAVATADSNSVAVNEGQLFIAFPNQIHYFKGDSSGIYYVFIINTDLFYGNEKLLNSHCPKSPLVETENDRNVQEYCDKIITLSYEDGKAEMVGYLNLLMASLLKKMELTPSGTNNSTTLHDILTYCADHYTEEITLSSVAEDMHLSPHYISHLFSERLNVGFSDYINTIRIKDAIRQLILTNKRIADISEESGFGSIRSFNRAFLKIMNCTPQDFRTRTKI